LFFLFSLGISVTVFSSLRALVQNTWLRAAVSLLPLVFFPDAPSLNYNTLGNGFFTAGTFLGIAHAYNRRTASAIFAALSHGLAIFVYPPLVIAVAAFAAALYWLTGRSRISLIALSASVVVPCVIWLALLVHFGLGNAGDVLKEETALKWAGRSDLGAMR